jgi:murein DD-endopeptidase MepM/ murein hydrolase activator NlpD
MQDNAKAIAALGNEPPLFGDGRRGPPDRREISTRWLSGTFLTGITSSVLMGVALLAALDGREQLATPPELANVESMGSSSGDAVKAARVIAPRAVARAKDRRRMEVSTVMKVGDRDVIRTLPFVQVKMALAAGHTTTRPYPAFDPLAVFAEDGAAQKVTASTGLIYGAKVESEVSLKTIDFPVETANFDETSELSVDEVEEVVRETADVLTDGAVQVAALHYVDPQRFGQPFGLDALGVPYGVKIVQENVSVAPMDLGGGAETEFAEDIIPFTADQEIAKAFADAGYAEEDSAGMVGALQTLMSAEALKAGTVLRIGIETRDDVSRIVRASVYERARHVLTIAVNDRGQFVPGDEPEPSPDVLTAFDDSPPVQVRGDLPNAYDAIYRAAFSYGLTKDMTRRLVKLLASDVDYQARVHPADRIQVFFSNPDENDAATDESQLLFVSATLGGNTRSFYRFQMDDGTVDYFNEEGRSARPFLLRKAVPTGQFRSGFGMRRHPILHYSRMHTGVDWAAPSGTPIIAAGDGVVEKAGWDRGYGRQTIIRHANGYESSYNHQSAFAQGIVPGVQVRQGQVIGYVGASGLATGPHLHYELIVNGTKVDPMRVRLPNSKVLKGPELEEFQRERARIDELLEEEADGSLKMASMR